MYVALSCQVSLKCSYLVDYEGNSAFWSCRTANLRKGLLYFLYTLEILPISHFWQLHVHSFSSLNNKKWLMFSLSVQSLIKNCSWGSTDEPNKLYRVTLNHTPILFYASSTERKLCKHPTLSQDCRQSMMPTHCFLLTLEVIKGPLEKKRILR